MGRTRAQAQLWSVVVFILVVLVLLFVGFLLLGQAEVAQPGVVIPA